MLRDLERPSDLGEPRRTDAAPLDRARLLATALFAEGKRIDAEGRLDPAIFSLLKASGLPLAVFPARHGGDDMIAPACASDLCRLLRLVGGGDLSVSRLFEGHVNAVILVARYGTPEQLGAMASRAEQGELSGVWNAEGSRPLVAEASGNGWRLSGEKILASGAGHIRHPIVPARTVDGIVMLMPALDDDTPVNLDRWTPQGMRASATGTVTLDGCIVDRAGQIGATGDYMRQPTFSGGAWRFCAVHLGAAERLVDLFLAELVARGRQADPYQKQRVAQCVAATTSAALWVERAAVMLSRGVDAPKAVVAFVNLTRMVTERACLDVLECVHRGLGLGSFIRPHPVERITRDLSTYLRQPVPDAAMADAASFVLQSDRSTADLWDL